MKIRQRATIISINHINKNFEVKITDHLKDSFGISLEDDDNVLLPLPRENLSYYFEVGDVIEFKKLSKHGFKVINLTCEVLRLYKFKRELTSILRRLDNDNHPLKRCIILSEPYLVLLSIKKNPEKINFFTKAHEKIENNHEKF